MLNDITLMGRLVKNPDTRKTSTGKSVTSFTLAVERDIKTNGEKETDFIDIVTWNGTADLVAKYFTKGRMAVVRGRLQIRTWKDKDGNNRKAAEVIADSVYFGDSKPTPTATAPADDFPVLEDKEPDLPFDDDDDLELPFF